MTKCRSDVFLGIVRSILEDAAKSYPELRRGFERDLTRLEALVASRGDHVFFVVFPDAAKALDQSLAQASLSVVGLPCFRARRPHSTVPKLFQGLWMRVFGDDGVLLPDADVNAVLFLRELLMFAKKYRVDAPEKALYKATKEYYDIDCALPIPSLNWSGDGSAIELHDADRPSFWSGSAAAYSLVHVDYTTGSTFRPIKGSDMETAVRMSFDILSGFIGEFIPGEHRFRHGPGATSEFPRGKGYKYAFTNWAPRLQHLFPYSEFALANPGVTGELFPLPEVSEEPSSRLIAVPKTYKGPRLIAAEPACHQWCQQSVREFLVERVAKTKLGAFIDFHNQQASKDLAQSAALSGELATIDLSSASDRLSCAVVESFCWKNPTLLAALVATRTQYLTNSIDKKIPSLIKLRKFASMGSALTFPVQSLVFLGLALAAGALTEYNRIGGHGYFNLWSAFSDLIGTGRSRQGSAVRSVRVYGDDIILPREWVPTLCHLLFACGLKVNQTKSFSEGNFRESCGMESFKGYDVTPAYFLELGDGSDPTSAVVYTAMANNFFEKGLWTTSEYIKSLVPLSVQKYIPTVNVEDGTFGTTSFMLGTPKPSVTRWNEELQREEFLGLLVSRKQDRARHEGHANLLQFFTEDPVETILTDWVSGMYRVGTLRVRKAWLPVSHRHG